MEDRGAPDAVIPAQTGIPAKAAKGSSAVAKDDRVFRDQQAARAPPEYCRSLGRPRLLQPSARIAAFFGSYGLSSVTSASHSSRNIRTFSLVPGVAASGLT